MQSLVSHLCNCSWLALDLVKHYYPKIGRSEHCCYLIRYKPGSITKCKTIQRMPNITTYLLTAFTHFFTHCACEGCRSCNDLALVIFKVNSGFMKFKLLFILASQS